MILEGPFKINLRDLVYRRLTIIIIFEGSMTDIKLPFDLKTSSTRAEMSQKILGTETVRRLIPPKAKEVLTFEDSNGIEIGSDMDVQTLWKGEANVLAKIELELTPEMKLLD